MGIEVMPIFSIDPPPKNTVVKNVANLNLELPVGITLLPKGSIPGLALNLLTQSLQNSLGAIVDITSNNY